MRPTYKMMALLTLTVPLSVLAGCASQNEMSALLSEVTTNQEMARSAQSQAVAVAAEASAAAAAASAAAVAAEQAAAEEDFLIVASIGNGTNERTPKPLYPGAGSNVLGVGVDAVFDEFGHCLQRIRL